MYTQFVNRENSELRSHTQHGHRTRECPKRDKAQSGTALAYGPTYGTRRASIGSQSALEHPCGSGDQPITKERSPSVEISTGDDSAVPSV